MPEDNSSDRKRRDILKALSVATVGVPMVSGVGAALPDTSETSDERLTREEKARQEGYDWNEDWIDQDMIGESSVETTETFSTDQAACASIDATISGIDFTLEVCFSTCEATLTVTVFGQSESTTVTCSEYCRSLSLNGGAAYIDLEVCFNWDRNCVDLNAEGCVWEITSWNCDTTNISACA